MSSTLPGWDARYPDRGRLRSEALCMAECFRDRLIEVIPRAEVRGIYFKGSAVKDWESPLDYVPEVSDVDMHIWFHDDAAWPKHLGTVHQALEVSAGVEALFAARMAHPLHQPRPQLVILNKMMAELEGFSHSPQSTVKVLYGEEYPKGDYSDSDAIRRQDAGNLAYESGWVDRMPLQLVDRPGRYLREATRTLSWRISPIGSRVLHVSGLDTERAWNMNRTKVAVSLRDRGFASLADDYIAYYVSMWDYFLSGFADSGAARSGIEYAVRLLMESGEAGRKWLAANPGPEASL